MNILVAGGAGYIGSVTVEQLIRAGHQVSVLDNLSRGHAEAVPSEAAFLQGDLADEAFLDRVFSGRRFDAVMHFSASSLVGESVTDPAAYYYNNLSNGIKLVRAMLAHDVKRFVFSSTAAVFGEPKSVPIKEDDAKQPENPYGRTKLFFEAFLHDCDVAYGLKSVCLRYFNAAGATVNCGEDHSPETHLIPIVLQVASGKRDALQVFGRDYATPDGTCVRDYIHVVDLANAHLLAVDHLGKGGSSRAFNLGNGSGYSVLQVINAAERVTGKPIAYKVGERRAGDPATLVASSEKIRSELGWTPQFPELEPIIQSAWAWMQAHPNGYR